MNNDQKKKSFSVGLTIYICLVYLIYFWLLHAGNGVGAAFVAYGFTPVLICINAIIISVILVVGKTHSIIVTNVINIIIGLITYVLLLMYYYLSHYKCLSNNKKNLISEDGQAYQIK